MESGCNGHRGAHALNRVEVGHRADQELVIPPKMEENRAQEMELSLNLVTPKNVYRVSFQLHITWLAISTRNNSSNP